MELIIFIILLAGGLIVLATFLAAEVGIAIDQWWADKERRRRVVRYELDKAAIAWAQGRKRGHAYDCISRDRDRGRGGDA